MNKLKEIFDTLTSFYGLCLIAVTLITFMVSCFNSSINDKIETEHIVIIERIKLLEDNNRLKYIYAIHRVYSLLHNNEVVTTSELEFIIRNRSIYVIDDEIVSEKLKYIYNVYIQRTR